MNMRNKCGNYTKAKNLFHVPQFQQQQIAVCRRLVVGRVDLSVLSSPIQSVRL